ncbi:MAG: BON domain-containing protein, partial [Flavitalea sp.]
MKSILPILFVVFMASCGPSDDAITKEVNTSLTSSGTSVTAQVSNGVVTLTGVCPDEACKTSSEAVVNVVKGVKSVVNNITVPPPPPPPTPVVINPDDSLNTAVNDIIAKDYPNVKSTVSGGVITLTGDIKRSQLTGLM